MFWIIFMFQGMETTSTLTSGTCTSTLGAWGTLLRCWELPSPALMPASMVRIHRLNKQQQNVKICTLKWLMQFEAVNKAFSVSADFLWLRRRWQTNGLFAFVSLQAHCWWWTVRRSISQKRSPSWGETLTTACHLLSLVTGTTPRSWERSSSMMKTRGTQLSLRVYYYIDIDTVAITLANKKTIKT